MPEIDDAATLTTELVRFVRAFGLHRPDDTPCGSGVSVSEAHALAALSAAPAMTQGELAAELNLTKSTVSRLVDQLVGRDWVDVTTADADRRCRVLSLTSGGRQAASAFDVHRRQRMATLLDGIPTEKRAGVVDALRLLSEAARASK